MYKKILLFIFLFVTTVNSNELKITEYKGNFCYDGDTCYGTLSGAPESLKFVRIRIRGIDTPEIKGECEKERKLAQKAKLYINKAINEAHLVTLRNLKWGKYGGRIIADLYIDNTNYLKYIEDEDFFVFYNGSRKIKDWCN